MRDDFSNAHYQKTVFATVYQYLYQKKVAMEPLFNNIFDNFWYRKSFADNRKLWFFDTDK